MASLENSSTIDWLFIVSTGVLVSILLSQLAQLVFDRTAPEVLLYIAIFGFCIALYALNLL